MPSYTLITPNITTYPYFKVNLAKCKNVTENVAKLYTRVSQRLAITSVRHCNVIKEIRGVIVNHSHNREKFSARCRVGKMSSSVEREEEIGENIDFVVFVDRQEAFDSVESIVNRTLLLPFGDLALV